MTPPPRLAFWSAVGAALLCPGNAWNVTNAWNTTNGLSNATVDPTTFFQDPAEVLAVPLRRVDQYGVGTPSLARRFFKTDVLGVYGAAYLAQRKPLPPCPSLPHGNTDPAATCSGRGDEHEEAEPQRAAGYGVVRAVGEPGLRQIGRAEAVPGLRPLRSRAVVHVAEPQPALRY